MGGSTATSGGVTWIPANGQATALGHPDTPEQAMLYLAQTVGTATPAALQERFARSAARMQDYLARHGLLQLAARAHAPDYYPDLPGATLGGRAMDPVVFDGRLLGPHFSQLRDPLRPFMVLGGMMVNTADAKHLLAVTRSFASWRHGMRLVARYAMDRLRGYHRGTRLVLGNALAGQLFHGVLRRGIPYWLGAGVTQIHTEAGAVQGVRVVRDGVVNEVRARRGVVVATGGFPWHAAMRTQLFPQPTGDWSAAPRDNRGEGIALARQAGGVLGQGAAGPALWAPVSILRRPDGETVRYPHLVWDRAKPGLMAVNSAGRRFVNESTTYHEFVLAMQRSHAQVPSIPAYLVCDADFMHKWGLGLALPGGRARQHLIDADYLVQADSLEGLAQALQIDAQGLKASAAQFNEAAQTGTDTAFGKGSNAYHQHLGDPAHNGPNPCLGPLLRAPFFAVAVYAGDIGTAIGIQCDENSQALDASGAPIPGLYAAGNDMHSVMGGRYPSAGITLGPALTFGWLAGQHLARQPERAARTAAAQAPSPTPSPTSTTAMV
ncbi:MAG: FAD-binding dehydrogenase [Rhodoferax sp.]|nr:FAD-binding dehydrogenase [Rhodoferax sp.]